MWRIRLVLVGLLLISASTPPVSVTQAATWHQADLVRELWLDISLGAPLVDWFNRVARPDDIARVEHVGQVSLLKDITVGRRMVVFKSIDEAEQALPVLADQIDIIGYNLESGPNYRSEEQADPVGSVQRMHDLAQQYDLKLAFGPDHDFALRYGVVIAPYVDIFVLQVQRVQTEPATVFDYVLPMAKRLRRANPDIEISVQVRTEGDVMEVVDLIDAMNDNLDGVSVLTSPETVDMAEALVAELQTRENTISSPPTLLARPTELPYVAEGRETAAPTSTRDAGLSCPLMVVGALIAGGVGGALSTALVCASRSRSADK